MSTTNLKGVTDAIYAAVTGTPMTAPPPAPLPQTWQPTKGPESENNLSAGDHDGRFLLDVDNEPAKLGIEFGVSSQQVIQRRVDVILFREAPQLPLGGGLGNKIDFDVQFLDDARAVADAVEKYSSYPAGTDTVIHRTSVIEYPGHENWVQVRVIFDVRYEAKYAASL